MIIQPGQTVADFSTFRPPDVLKAAGYVGWAGYADGTADEPRPSSKCISRPHVKELHDAILGGWLIYENSSTDATRASDDWAYGWERGYRAAGEARFHNYPKDVGYIVAADQDIYAGNVAEAVRFWQGFDAAYSLAFGGVTGVYGDYDLIDALSKLPGRKPVVYWQAAATWWSRLWHISRWIYRLHPLTHFRQYGDKFHIGVDHNVCLRACKAWGPPTPTTPTEDDDMPKIVRMTDGDPAQFVATGKQLTWITDHAERDALVFLGQATLDTDGAPFGWPRAALRNFTLIGDKPAAPSTITPAEFGAHVPAVKR